MTVAGVFRDENRHTCIRVALNNHRTGFIAMSVTELKISHMLTKQFDKTYEPIADYDVARAARLYLTGLDGVKIPITREAQAALEKLAGPRFVREDLSDIPPPDFSNPANGESSMATNTTPKKRKATAEAAPAKANPIKAKAEDASGKRGRQPNIDGTAKIKILVKDNPKRAAAAERFNLYKNGMTVDEYIAAGGARADVNWDVKQGFIEVR